MTKLETGLPDRGDRGQSHAGSLHIVKSNHRYIFRNPNAVLLRGIDCCCGKDVGAGKEGVRSLLRVQSLRDGRVGQSVVDGRYRDIPLGMNRKPGAFQCFQVSLPAVPRILIFQAAVDKAYNFLRMKFGTGSLKIGNIQLPYITFLFVALTIFFIFMMSKTKFGKSIYAVGSNEKTSHLTGISVQWVKVSVFVITGLLVGVASFIQACKIGNVTPASSGTSYEMYAIAAVVLGGVNMAGGRGKILGVFFGALSYTTINLIIVSIPQLSTDIQDTFQGIVLIAVIFIQTVGPVIREKFVELRKRAQNTDK